MLAIRCLLAGFALAARPRVAGRAFVLALTLLTLPACDSKTDGDPEWSEGGSGGGTGGVGGVGGVGGLGGGGGATGDGGSTGTWLGSVVRFATAAEASAVLGASDDYTQAHSDFDRGLRLKTTAPVSEDDYLDLAGQETLDWTALEMAVWQDAIDGIGAALEGFDQLLVPAEVLLIKTTGNEELGAAAYTRGAAIILSQPAVTSLVNAGAPHPLSLTSHEAMHVFSRYDSTLRDTLAPIFGFDSFDGVAYPSALEPQQLTNPDAYSLRHAIPVTLTQGSVSLTVVPINQFDVPLATAIGLQNPFSAMGLYLLEVDVLNATVLSDIPIPVADTDYTQLTSINTDYIIHPEEIIADNFAFLMVRRSSGSSSVPDQEVLDQIEMALSGN